MLLALMMMPFAGCAEGLYEAQPAHGAEIFHADSPEEEMRRIAYGLSILLGIALTLSCVRVLKKSGAGGGAPLADCPAAIAELVAKGKVGADGLTGAILELVQMGVLALENPDAHSPLNEGVRLRITQVSHKMLEEHQQALLDWFFGEGNVIRLSQIAPEPRAFLAKFDHWAEQVRQDAQALFLTDARGMSPVFGMGAQGVLGAVTALMWAACGLWPLAGAAAALCALALWAQAGLGALESPFERTRAYLKALQKSGEVKGEEGWDKLPLMAALLGASKARSAFLEAAGQEGAPSWALAPHMEEAIQSLAQTFQHALSQAEKPRAL